jgi:hypothetical protein
MNTLQREHFQRAMAEARRLFSMFQRLPIEADLSRT